MRFSLSSSHALLEMKCDMQISYEMVSNAHVHQLTVSLLRQQARVRLHNVCHQGCSYLTKLLVYVNVYELGSGARRSSWPHVG